MKKITFIASILLLTSCAQKTIQIADGSYITERKFKKEIRKSYNAAMKEMSKEERKVIKTSFFSVETEDNN